MQRYRPDFRALLLAVALSFAPILAAQQAAPPAQSTTAAKAPAVRAAASAEKLEKHGLPNLGKVSETLYRGAQPKDDGYAELKKLGIEVVVNLREEAGEIEKERKKVEALGLRYVSLPENPMARPNNARVAEFLQLLRANPGTKIFVHCQRGAERTGVMIAAYRISAQQWTPEQAIKEMYDFHFRGWFFPQLKSYVREFPTLLVSDPDLKKAVNADKVLPATAIVP